MQGSSVVVGQDLPGLDVRDGSLHDVADSAQGLARLSLGLGGLAVRRFLTGVTTPFPMWPLSAMQQEGAICSSTPEVVMALESWVAPGMGPRPTAGAR